VPLLILILFLLLSFDFNTSMTVYQSSDAFIAEQENLSLQVAGRQGKRRRDDCKDSPNGCQIISSIKLEQTISDDVDKRFIG
jgi:hypothetical protein